jgi:hypothetical protein
MILQIFFNIIMIADHNMMLAFHTYFSRKGINIRGVKPPKTMPRVADRMLGSRRDATRSAMTWAKMAPRMPATKPLDIFLKID